MAFCGKCGSPIGKESFCPNCGAPNEAVSNMSHPVVARTKGAGSGKIFVLGIILIAAVVVVAFLVFGRKSTSDLIIGRWVFEEDSTSGFEFFQDGEAIAFHGTTTESMNWSISERSLRLSNPYGTDVLLFEIDEISGRRLVLSLNGEEIALSKD